MAKGSILSSLMSDVRVTEKKPKAKKTKKKPTATPKEKSKWGTPVEQYRRLCLLAQFCRYSYYVKATSIIPDKLYDELEALILKVEDKNRQLQYDWSPTLRPGSDKDENYPRSVQDLWYCHGDDPRSFSSVQAVIEKQMSSVVEVFALE